MSRKQTNYTKYLESHQFKVSAINETNLTYICRDGHSTELTLTSFGNKKAKCKDDPRLLCTEWKGIVDRDAQRVELDGKSNHRILAYHDKERVEFICNNCGRQKISTKKSLETSEYCAFCQNHHNRKPHHEVERQVVEKGMILLTTAEQYTDNKSITVQCCCGEEWTTSLADINRGRRCVKCQVKRTIETNNMIYGVDNVMHCDEIFQKSISSKQREYVFKDGTTTLILGYEDLCLKELEESNLYKIIYAGNNENIPSFWYEDEGIKRKYYPDIYLPETNTIIEVKSQYYLDAFDAYDRNISKALEVSKTHNFLLYVYAYTKNRIIYKHVNGKFQIA